PLCARSPLPYSPLFRSFLPRMVRAAARRLSVRLDQVDGNGALPLRASDRGFPTAHSFRRHLHKTLATHLDVFPEADPLKGYDLGDRKSTRLNSSHVKIS